MLENELSNRIIGISSQDVIGGEYLPFLQFKGLRIGVFGSIFHMCCYLWQMVITKSQKIGPDSI